MERVSTGWAAIPELRYDAAAQTLTLIYASGETRLITAVSRSGFDRLIGKPDGSVEADERQAWCDVAGLLLLIRRSVGQALFHFRYLNRRGRRQCS
jgi:hypothetical protein